MPLALGVIPARYASTRLPGKPLVPLGKAPLIEHVWRRASTAAGFDRVVVATDDTRIADAAHGFGAEVMMTSPDHPSGTDRVAEVVRSSGDRYDVVVNIQGDEPLVTPSSLDRLIDAFEDDDAPSMATLAEPLSDIDELLNPNVVKVVRRRDGQALYFSRSPVPYHRGGSGADLRAGLAARTGGLQGYLKHQGIYAYSRETLLALAGMPPSPLETDEALEQLRALEAGYSILVLDSDFRSHGVDTPDDVRRVLELMNDSDGAGGAAPGAAEGALPGEAR